MSAEDESKSRCWADMTDDEEDVAAANNKHEQGKDTRPQSRMSQRGGGRRAPTASDGGAVSGRRHHNDRGRSSLPRHPTASSTVPSDKGRPYRLHVANLPINADSRMVQEIFAPIEVLEAEFPSTQNQHQSRYCFVKVKDFTDYKTALMSTNKYEGRIIYVKPTRNDGSQRRKRSEESKPKPESRPATTATIPRRRLQLSALLGPEDEEKRDTSIFGLGKPREETELTPAAEPAPHIPEPTNTVQIRAPAVAAKPSASTAPPLPAAAPVEEDESKSQVSHHPESEDALKRCVRNRSVEDPYGHPNEQAPMRYVPMIRPRNDAPAAYCMWGGTAPPPLRQMMPPPYMGRPSLVNFGDPKGTHFAEGFTPIMYPHAMYSAPGAYVPHLPYVPSPPPPPAEEVVRPRPRPIMVQPVQPPKDIVTFNNKDVDDPPPPPPAPVAPPRVDQKKRWADVVRSDSSEGKKRV